LTQCKKAVTQISRIHGLAGQWCSYYRCFKWRFLI